MMFQTLVRFWLSHPALFYGISLLLGFYVTFTHSFVLIMPGLALWLPFCAVIWRKHFAFWKPFLLSFTLFAATYCFASVYYIFPLLPETGVKGKGHITIDSIRLQRSFFGSRWIYQCQLLNFFPDHENERSIARNIPCSISIPQNSQINRPTADHDYLINGILVETKNGRYFLKISPKSPWSIIEHASSWAESRYKWKKIALEFIHGHFPTALSAAFLGGLATGEFDDQWMRQEFSRFGLQHIMAISGFHFAIMVGIFSLILRLFLSRRLSGYFLLLVMGGYVLFLGSNPSILRAWIMSALIIGGTLIEKNGSSLNMLGAALIGTLAFDPLFCLSIGFQFSFLVTGAILLVYGTADHCFKQILPKRPLSEMVEMNLLNQHGYCLLTFFRQGLALMVAVNIYALPLTLFYFHQFPWMSLLYNLFFPLLIAGSLSLLVLGMLVSWVPIVSSLLNGFNDKYTSAILQITYRMPSSLDYNFTIDDFPLEWLVAYLCLTILGSIVLKEGAVKQDEQPLFV